MPRSNRHKLFEELGLLARAPETNPFRDLGLDPQLARELIDNDSTGETLQSVAAGMYRVLSRVHHPDTKKGDAERFRIIAGANKRVTEATKDDLIRWTAKENSSPVATQSTKQLAAQEAVMQRAAQLVANNMELGSNLLHFSQLRWAQGVVLRRGDATFLARTSADGLQIVKGEEYSVGKANPGLSSYVQAFDFQRFMKLNDSFGLEPGKKIAAYFDEKKGATILNADLSFMMDISGPVAEYRSTRRSFASHDGADAWTRFADPALVTTQVPGHAESAYVLPEFTTFPLLHSATTETGRIRPTRLERRVAMEIAGSVADTDLFRKIRFNVKAGAVALTGSKRAASHFGMSGIPIRQLVEQDVGYTSLVAPNNSLLLFDPANSMPVITDARVVGVIGNGVRA